VFVSTENAVARTVGAAIIATRLSIIAPENALVEAHVVRIKYANALRDSLALLVRLTRATIVQAIATDW
jgi:hypothetical protein